jgi:hypothetical protein
MVVALHHLQLLLNGLELTISIHRLDGLGKGTQLSALKSPSQSLDGGGSA